jgi:hypothetical protein
VEPLAGTAASVGGKGDGCDPIVSRAACSMQTGFPLPSTRSRRRVFELTNTSITLLSKHTIRCCPPASPRASPSPYSCPGGAAPLSRRPSRRRRRARPWPSSTTTRRCVGLFYVCVIDPVAIMRVGSRSSPSTDQSNQSVERGVLVVVVVMIVPVYPPHPADVKQLIPPPQHTTDQHPQTQGLYYNRTAVQPKLDYECANGEAWLRKCSAAESDPT